jgi:hypothetical protein
MLRGKREEGKGNKGAGMSKGKRCEEIDASKGG